MTTPAPDSATTANSTSTESNKRSNRRPRILLGVCGSVAAVKAPEIAVRLSQSKIDVRILLTKGGRNFWDKASDYNVKYWKLVQEHIETSKSAVIHETYTTNNLEQEGHVHLHDADEEWNEWNRLGDPVLHIDLRDWADVLLIAPLSAHTLAKLAHGLCDDALSCVVRAWDFGHGNRPGKPLLLAPAMNTAMWLHPLTQQQLHEIQCFWNTSYAPSNSNTLTSGVSIINPDVKALACGEVGTGALASVENILVAVQDTLHAIGYQLG